MIAVEVTLILAGTFLCVILFFAVFTLCKYIRNKNRKKKSNDHPQLIVKNPSEFSIIKVKTQLPVKDGDRTKYPSSSIFVNEWVHTFGRRNSPTIVVSDEYYPKYSERSDSISHEAPLVVKERSSSQIELKQRKISNGALEQLAKQGKQVCNSDLRSRSELFSEDDSLSWEIDSLNNDAEYNSADSFLSDSDQSCSSYSSTGVIECNKKHLHGIKRKIASNRKNNQTNLLKRKKIGTITMKTKFLSSSNTLEVWISRVVYFNHKKPNSCLNFFVLLSIMPEKIQVQSSKCIKGSNEFNFNEQFCFQDITKLNRCNLQIKLIKHNKMKKFHKQIIGEAQIPITDLSYAGEESNISCDLFWHFTTKASLGSINISLCHQATISKLDVIITEAKSLPKFSNPYVTVSLFREETIEMKNTSKKYNSSNPIFNESIEFDICTDISNPLSVYTMVVTVNDSSFLGKNCVIGHVIFSLLSPQKSAVTHWQLVQDSPHQSHSEWHTLIDPNEI
ncbi:synaptotagmin-4 isoform X1 [Hydra vulgaris]|uniref:synaptotagmin-4 isoform X1 n=1 Tax=Hydra vulgaris TaxID=6087 RepID=UPI000640D203|nr:synaptotagmin-4-like [Hydra vulgaris]